MSVNKINSISYGDITKICGIDVAGLTKINGQELSAAAPPPPADGATVAVVGSTKGWMGYSDGTGDWGSGTWGFYDTGLDTAYEVEYGFKPDGTELWILSINKTARPLKYSTSPMPTVTGDWTNLDVIHSTQPSYGSAYGYSGSNNIATFVAVGNNARVSDTQSGDPTNTSNWTQSSRLNVDCSSTAQVRDVAFNGDTVNPVFVAVTNGGFIASSTDGNSWTTRRDINNADKALYRVEFGNGTWIACGYYGDMEHMRGSADASSWSVMNTPASPSATSMYGVATDGNGNWIMVGSLGYVWTSGDDGVSWTEQQVPDSRGAGNYSNMFDIAYDNDGTWVAVGGASEIWKSTDNGSSWTSVTPSRASYQAFQSIQFNKTKA
jgi:hypothetical protein